MCQNEDEVRLSDLQRDRDYELAKHRRWPLHADCRWQMQRQLTLSLTNQFVRYLAIAISSRYQGPHHMGCINH